tara:strand:+ start:15111 stop:16175 length:1065 start_codon:yes stop_codon:yes gene_type:complete
MKLSSLFKGKVYAFPQTQNQEQDLAFAKKVVEKINPSLEIDDIAVGKIEDNYDVFSIKDKNKNNYKLKISLDDSDGTLKKEANIIKNCQSKTVPIFKSYGQIKIGEEISYLFTSVPQYESVRNYGRSCLMENLNLFFRNYVDFQKTKSVRPTYNTSLKKFLLNLDPVNYLPTDSLRAFESYTDYPLCRKFMNDLREESLSLIDNVDLPYKFKCHGGLSLDNIFFDKKMFYFDNFEFVFMGHPFIDLTDLLLELGVPEESQYAILSKFCLETKIPEDRELFNKLYQIQLRKKLGDLISNYIKEIYVYDSYRYDNILNIADVFSHCYERFCKIEIFNKNRDFIMKTICEPIFGVKA